MFARSKATVAQLVEQRIRNAWVSGSSPLGGSFFLASQPHLRPNSRIVGYATVSIVTLTVLLLGWRLYTYTQLERDHLWVHFSGTGDLIGSLQEDDPVAIQGVNVGQVEDIRSDSTGVVARLRFWKHQRIYRDARAVNVGNGLMGMRYVLLEPGIDSAHPLDRQAMIEGYFQPGVAEVMSGIQELVNKVRKIQAWVRDQANGTPGQAPLHRQILSQLAATDTLLQNIERVTHKAENLGPTLRSGSGLALGIADTLRAMEPDLVKTLASTDTLLLQIQHMVSQSRGLVHQGDTLVRDLAGPLEPLTRDDSLLRQVQRTLMVVDMLENFMDGKTRVKTNIHLLGNNPSKRGE